jgi:hypothetical protein
MFFTLIFEVLIKIYEFYLMNRKIVKNESVLIALDLLFFFFKVFSQKLMKTPYKTRKNRVGGT